MDRYVHKLSLIFHCMIIVALEKSEDFAPPILENKKT